jgi:hypothetical protein
MKQKILLLCMGLWTSISMLAFNGNGTENDPYLITSQSDMIELSKMVNDGTDFFGIYFRLTKDLKEIRSIIGVDGDHPFRGIFDGDGHRLTVNIHTTDSYIGVFGYVKNATIKNLGVAGNVLRMVQASTAYAGGICGVLEMSTITGCYNTAVVSTFSSESFASYSGGICGDAYNYSTIKDCYNTGDIYSSAPVISSSFSGGISGDVFYYSIISNCYNIGEISSLPIDARSSSGGICGSAINSSKISNCFAANTVIVGGSAGRVAGAVESDVTLTNNHAQNYLLVNNFEVNSGNAAGKEGASTNPDSFQDLKWLEGNLKWDFKTVWRISRGDLPALRLHYLE